VAFTRTWLRGILSASAVTVLVPAGVIAALLAAALGHGFGGLGSLRQLVSGPNIPPKLAFSGPAATGHGPVLPIIPAPVTHHSGATVSPHRVRIVTRHTVAPVHGAPARPTRRPVRKRVPVAHAPPSAVNPAPSTPAPSTPSPTTGTTSTGTTPTASAPGGLIPALSPTLHQVGQAVQNVANAVPIVGPTVSGVVGTVVTLLAGPSN
jgi:hypothetical protein